MNVIEFDNVVNCTTRPVALLGYGGRLGYEESRVVVPPSPFGVWLPECRIHVGNVKVDGKKVFVYEVSYGEPVLYDRSSRKPIELLPWTNENTLLVVPPFVWEAIRNRYPGLRVTRLIDPRMGPNGVVEATALGI